MGEEGLQELINGCINQDRSSQKMLYKSFYGFSMSICLRYVSNREEAIEIMNQGFFKVFTKIGSYTDGRPFKNWLGKIMKNAAIDYYRANLKMAYAEDLDNVVDYVTDINMAENNLNYNDLLAMVNQLPNAYRTVFNLFAIDGYSHEEIATMLNISTGTSKSNLFKARKKLKELIAAADASGNTISYHNKIAAPVEEYNGNTFIGYQLSF
jgi:RNA polymerase sigma factor (sigma-70 family)